MPRMAAPMAGSGRGGGWRQAWVPALALAVGAATLWLLSRWGPPTDTFAASSPIAAVADLAAGLGLMAAGAFAWLSWWRPTVGLVAVLAGIAWLGADWLGWSGGPPVVRSLGLVVGPFLVPLLIHLVAAITGRDRGRITRTVIAALYLATGLLALGWAATYQPYHFIACWPACAQDALIVPLPWDEAARAILKALQMLAVVAGIGLAAWALAALLRGTSPMRRRDAVVLVPAVAVGLSIAACAIAALLHPAMAPDEPLLTIAGEKKDTTISLLTHGTLLLALAISVAMLAGGVGWVVARARARNAAVRRLVIGLGDAPGSVQGALARAVGDPTLQVSYRLPGTDRFIEGDGTPADLAPDHPGRAVTSIEREGEPVALITHDASVEGPVLRGQLGAAARVAIDNERLGAVLLAQLRELRESRTRIVEAGDATRRRLERDLHDGVQQRLLALTFDLRIARLEVGRAGTPKLVEVLEQGESQATSVLETLRDLARGIHPTILSRAGLGAALAGLATDARLPVELSAGTIGRYAAAVESAAYQLVAEGVQEALRAGASHAGVRLRPTADLLIVEIEDDSDRPFESLVRLGDRIGAIGGRLLHGSADPGPGRWLRAEVPCASS